jgi:nitrogen fixation NifU-like protein
MAYGNEVLNRFKNPKNVGKLDKNAKDTGIGTVGAPECGDVLQLSLQVDDKDIIIDAKFLAFGCGAAIASSEYLTEQIIGKTLHQAKQITNQDIAHALALPPIKHHCSVLAAEAIQEAAKDLGNKRANFAK